MFRYYNPVKVLFGKGTMDEVGVSVKEYAQTDKILLMTGKRAMREQGITEKIEKMIEKEGYKVEVYEEVKENPTLTDIEEIRSKYSEKGIGLILGLGGGSVLDSAKTTAILLTNKEKVLDYLQGKKKIEKEGIPFIGLPTTAGTGSEVTMWATIWDMENKVKYSLAHEKMYAKVAIVDPLLTVKLPKRVTAITALDALAQAIEAYWAKKHNPISDQYAIKAIKLLIENIEKIYSNPENIDIREKIALGSVMSGLAFSNTKTTAVHSVSYPLTANFHIPHGLACALTLGSFYVYNTQKEDNLPEIPEKMAKLTNILNCATAEEVKIKLQEIMEKVELPTTLKEVGVKENDLSSLVEESYTKGRMDNNPRTVTKGELEKLLKALM